MAINGYLLKNISEKFEMICCRLGCPVEVNNYVIGRCGISLDIKPALGVRIEDLLKISDDIALQLGVYYMQVVPPGNGSWKMQVNLLMAQPRALDLCDCDEILRTGPYKDFLCLGSDVVSKPVMLNMKENPNILVVGKNADRKQAFIEVLEVQAVSSAANSYEAIHIKPENAITTLEELDKESMSGNYMVLIDEYAELLRAHGEEAERCIAKLTLRPASSNIRLLLATEYPAVDVVSGVIKYGFPTRIAFRLNNKIESRTVLDVAGAENLAGPGEALLVSRDAKSPVWFEIPENTDG